MPGFPNRIVRSSLGPTLLDRWSVTDPRYDVGQEVLNLLFWQCAGMNLTSARGLLYVNGTSGGATTLYQGFSWDVDVAMPKVTWTRVAAGKYEFQLPATQYPDNKGNLVTIDFLGGEVRPMASAAWELLIPSFYKSSARSGSIAIYSHAGSTYVDRDFLLGLW